MTNTYRATSAVGEHYYGEGVTEHDLSAVDEKDALSGGHLEIVPRKYKVLSSNYEAGAPGEEFERAYPIELEAALISGGHIERVDEPEPEPEPADEPKPKKTAKKAATAAEKKE